MFTKNVLCIEITQKTYFCFQSQKINIWQMNAIELSENKSCQTYFLSLFFRSL